VFEWVFAGSGEKRINVLFLEVVVGHEKLALDRPNVARRTLFGNDVNARVGLVATMRPFRPKPNVHAKKVSIEGVFCEVARNEALEFIAKITLVGGLLTEGFENVVDGLAHR
jgi:hypothetical protein